MTLPSEVLYRITLQANGLACTVCGTDFRSGRVARVQVGTSDKGAKLFDCEAHAEKKDGDKQ